MQALRPFEQWNRDYVGSGVAKATLAREFSISIGRDTVYQYLRAAP